MANNALDRQQPISQASKITQLRQAHSYPDKPQRVEVIETHMSWVFLTDDYAYKLKKPVRYAFLDFTTLEARQHDCAEEVRLNRRLAGNVYLGIVPLAIDSAGRVGVDGAGEVIDWLVKMRRLPADRMLDFMITHNTIKEEDVRAIGHVLAAFYRQCLPVKLDAVQYRQDYEQQVRANLDALAESRFGLSDTLLKVIHDAQLEFIQQEPEVFDSRVVQGRIIEGHGDLRPEHICLETRPVIFDCLEFNKLFRIVDAADEIAFLAMECERLGAARIGRVLFEVYGDDTGDDPPQRLINFYKSSRACLRAKLTIWHVQELQESAWPQWRERANDYLRLAEHYALQLL